MNEVRVGGSLVMDALDTPTRTGEYINLLQDIYDITTPYKGMKVFCAETGMEYVVTELTEKTINGVVVTGAMVKSFIPLAYKGDVEALEEYTKEEVDRLDDVATIRFSRILEGTVNVVPSKVENPAEIVFYKAGGKFVAKNAQGKYFDEWDGKEAYMKNGELRKDCVYMSEGSFYMWNGTTLVLDVELTNEIARAKAAESALQANIAAEAERAKAAEEVLSGGTTARFGSVEDSTKNIMQGLHDFTLAEVVYYKPDKMFVAKGKDGNLYDTWNGSNAYMSGGAIRKDKIYICGGALYVWNGTELVDVTAELKQQFADLIAQNKSDIASEAQRAKAAEAALQANINAETERAKAAEAALQANINAETERAKAAEAESMCSPVVEIGGVSDATGLPIERTNRIRCRGLLRKDVRVIMTTPVGLYLWIVCTDKEGEVVKTVSNMWSSPNGWLDVDSLEGNIQQLHLVFKRADDSDVTDEDLVIAKEYVKNILTYYTRMSSYRLRCNVVATPFSVNGEKILINPNGFAVDYGLRGLYYVADESKAMTDPYVFDFSSLGSTGAAYLVLDTTKLSKKDKRNELSDVMSIKTTTPLPSDIVIAYYYNAGKKIIFMGQFQALVAEEEPTDPKRVNNEAAFAPEFYAYKWGRNNNANGVGTGWYQRFRLTHVSDVHSYLSQLNEAIEVSNDKVHVFVNTGDEAHGTSSSDAETVKSDLDASISAVKKHSNVPYLEVPGNHDVTGLTKKEYFERICSTVQQQTGNVVWGDAEGFRAYGYADFTDSAYKGNFRVIMLDPFDYNDGEFSTVYPHQSAVFSQKQIDWLIDTLLDAATKGLNVITTMHYSFGDAKYNNGETAYPDATYCQDTFMIPDIIDAIQNRSVLNKEYSDSKGVNNISINRDFSSAAELKFVAHLFGHIHSKNHFQCQKSDGSKKYDILMLGEAALATYGNALNKAYREVGTVNGIAFSVLEIDTVEKAVYRVAYGAYLNYDKSNSERTTKIPYRFSV